MSRSPVNVANEARKAAAMFWAMSPREKLTPEQRRAGYRIAMAASMTNCAMPSVWRKRAQSMLPFDD